MARWDVHFVHVPRTSRSAICIMNGSHPSVDIPHVTVLNWVNVKIKNMFAFSVSHHCGLIVRIILPEVSEIQILHYWL